jgi:hypothetical protein
MERWERKDVWLGILFLLMGALVTLWAFLALRRDVPRAWWGAGFLVGPLLLLLGGNAIVRSSRARDRDR